MTVEVILIYYICVVICNSVPFNLSFHKAEKGFAAADGGKIFVASFHKIYRKCLIWHTARSLTQRLSLLVAGWLLSALLSAVMAQDGEAGLRLGVAALGVILILSASLLYLGRRSGKAAEQAEESCREELCTLYTKRRGNDLSSGTFLTYIEKDVDTVSAYFSSSLPALLISALLFVFCGILLIVQYGWLGWGLTCIGLIQLLPTLVYEKWAKAIYEKAVMNDAAFSDWVSAGFRSVSTIKAFQREDWFMRRLKGYAQGVVTAARKENQAAYVEDTVTAFVSTVLTDGTYLIFGVAAVTGAIDIIQAPVIAVVARTAFSSVESMLQYRIQKRKYIQAQEHLSRLMPQDVKTDGCVQPFLLTATDISKAYGEKTVLSRCSVKIRQGERILLTGHNGSGKTTLLRILLGIERPDTGSVCYAGEQIAFCLQEEPDMTLSMRAFADEMAAVGRIDPARFERLAERFGIAGCMEQRPGECSEGQRKKYYLSLAFACPSELLLLDEPTNHLDSDSVDTLLRLIRDWQGALLIVSHDGRMDCPIRWAVEGGQLNERNG